jgi:hypothetical protein
MAKCIHCGAETELYFNGFPVWPDCDKNGTDLLLTANRANLQRNLKTTAKAT